MFTRIDNKRKKLVNNEIVWVPEKEIKPFWPEHIRVLAEHPDTAWFALHDALEELGLYKSAAHFVEGHCSPYICTFSEMIVKNANPDWGSMYWSLDDKIKIYLEIQQELEDWWSI